MTKHKTTSKTAKEAKPKYPCDSHGSSPIIHPAINKIPLGNGKTKLDTGNLALNAAAFGDIHGAIVDDADAKNVEVVIREHEDQLSKFCDKWHDVRDTGRITADDGIDWNFWHSIVMTSVDSADVEKYVNFIKALAANNELMKTVPHDGLVGLVNNVYTVPRILARFIRRRIEGLLAPTLEDDLYKPMSDCGLRYEYAVSPEKMPLCRAHILGDATSSLLTLTIYPVIGDTSNPDWKRGVHFETKLSIRA